MTAVSPSISRLPDSFDHALGLALTIAGFIGMVYFGYRLVRLFLYHRANYGGTFRAIIQEWIHHLRHH